MKRKGLGFGMGMGYRNLVPKDPLVHGLSAKGVKTHQIPSAYGHERPHQIRTALKKLGLNAKARPLYKNIGNWVFVKYPNEETYRASVYCKTEKDAKKIVEEGNSKSLDAKGIAKAKVYYGKHRFMYDTPELLKQVNDDNKDVVTMTRKDFKKYFSAMSSDKVMIDGKVEMAELGRIFAKYNDEGYADDRPYSKGKNPLATPKGQMKVRKSGTKHTSMSVGDIIKVDDDMYIVAPIGFKKVEVV